MNNISRRDFNKLGIFSMLAGLSPGLLVVDRVTGKPQEPTDDQLPPVMVRAAEEWQALLATGRLHLLPSVSRYHPNTGVERLPHYMGERAIPLVSPVLRCRVSQQEHSASMVKLGEQISATAMCVRGMLGRHSKRLMLTSPMFERVDVAHRRQECEFERGWMQIVSTCFAAWEEHLPYPVDHYITEMGFGFTATNFSDVMNYYLNTQRNCEPFYANNVYGRQNYAAETNPVRVPGNMEGCIDDFSPEYFNKNKRKYGEETIA